MAKIILEVTIESLKNEELDAAAGLAETALKTRFPNVEVSDEIDREEDEDDE